MNVREINTALSLGEITKEGVFPHLDTLKNSPHIFKISFGLDKLPVEPGMVLVRGARQYGKSTWLEGQIKSTIKRYGKGSAFYLNGDVIKDANSLAEKILELIPMFTKASRVKRIFIDEITGVKDWSKGLKYLFDSNELKDVLLVTTGSKAIDIRRGSERLPGRKGRLPRTQYLFTPISFSEFYTQSKRKFKRNSVWAYLLTGGSPLACTEMIQNEFIPEYIIEIIRDWIYGECSIANRNRSSLIAILENVLKRGGTISSQAKLAKESGLANNTVAAGYLEMLADLLCLSNAYSWDSSKKINLLRKPCKYHFINLLAAVTWDDSRIRTVEDFLGLEPASQGKWVEWLTAQELWRRSAIKGVESPEQMSFWSTKENEIDFVLDHKNFIEVKRGKCTPLDFSWFPKSFPKGHLTVINENKFETSHITGVTLEDFLLEKA